CVRCVRCVYSSYFYRIVIMKIWQPERCCGSSLRTGSLVVGSLALMRQAQSDVHVILEEESADL
ncbi:hypothetical protein Hamer_G024319, partial [Homarus americanus]